MADASEATVLSVVIAAQLVGLTSAGLARLLERSRSRSQLAAQAFFLFSLLIVGATTLVTMSSGSGAWLCCGATLPIMAVGATLDLRRGDAGGF